jgi:hypothetical protein
LKDRQSILLLHNMIPGRDVCLPAKKVRNRESFTCLRFVRQRKFV